MSCRESIVAIGVIAQLVAPIGASAEDLPDALNEPRTFARTWRGTVDLAGEAVVLDTIEAQRGRLTLVVGRVSNSSGENMAFLVPTSGKGLISTTWVASRRFAGAPLVVWSDGSCRDVRVRFDHTVGDLRRTAPWLEWGLRADDGELLALIDRSGVATGLTFRVLAGELIRFWDINDDGVALGSKDISVAAAISDSVADRWDSIALRYTTTRSHLLAIDALLTTTTAD
jgi:hypothetical protein